MEVKEIDRVRDDEMCCNCTRMERGAIEKVLGRKMRYVRIYTGDQSFRHVQQMCETCVKKMVNQFGEIGIIE